MGVVYLAEDMRLNRRVALKLIAPGLASDPRFRERFLREAELAASLDHPHVLPGYGAGGTDGRFGLARARQDEGLGPTAHLSGTAAYAAPERIAGRFVDGRADAYSLGCVLF